MRGAGQNVIPSPTDASTILKVKRHAVCQCAYVYFSKIKKLLPLAD